MRKLWVIIPLILISALPGRTQPGASLSGYLNDMQTAYYIEETGWLWENQVHNRLNLDLYPAGWLKVTLQARTRFIQGSTYSKFPGYADMIGRDAGWMDLTLSTNGTYNNSAGYVATTMLDRAYAEFSFGNFVGTIGRQRINWGQTFVWNPNDIFNAYSYFDVDYPERPGSDAVRLQYYTGIASNIELAAKLDSAGRVTAAGYFRFNALGYDFQMLGGILSGRDLVAGTGWSGNIAQTSFRGEVSYFRDLEHFADTTGDLLISAGVDHTFGNSLWLQTEVLYSAFAKQMHIYNFMQIFGTDMNIKRIGFTEWSVFASLSYPIHPLLNVSFAGMYYPDWKGFYLGPSVDLSLGNNLKSSLIVQGFSAELEDLQGNTKRQNTLIGYLRLKWSF
jgi:hypothetical protein